MTLNYIKLKITKIVVPINNNYYYKQQKGFNNLVLTSLIF